MRPGAPTSALASSPTLVGAVTVLITVVAIFLSYNANQGLPFVPVYRVSVDIPNAGRLIESNEVRIGGNRVGVVESLTPTSDGGDKAVARVTLKLNKSAQPIPEDSIFHVRYLSTFGLKYVEIVRGTGPPAPEGFVFDGSDDGESCELPVEPEGFYERIPASARNGCFEDQAEFDDLVNGIDADAREDTREVLTELGSGVAGRGSGVNAAVEVAPDLLEDLGPIARTLSARTTRLDRFIRALERTATATAPVSENLADSFGSAAIAFEAISRDPAAVQATISNAVPLLTDGPARLARARALLGDTAELARRLGPGARDLVPTLPILNDALEVGDAGAAEGAGDRARPPRDPRGARGPGQAALDGDRALPPARHLRPGAAAGSARRPGADRLQLLELHLDVPRRAPEPALEHRVLAAEHHRDAYRA